MSNYQQGIIGIYFCFTSLTTVGFGDYYPHSDSERLLCAFMLLFGVLMQSYTMGTFINMIENFKNFEEEVNLDNQLNRFINTLTRFNNNKLINKNWKEKIERYFEFKWTHDKNMSLDSKE